jgi:hypothetical protein
MVFDCLLGGTGSFFGDELILGSPLILLNSVVCASWSITVTFL